MKKNLRTVFTIILAAVMQFSLFTIIQASSLSGVNLKVIDFSSDHANPGGLNDYGAVLAVDGNPDTFWSNDYSPKKSPPHHITIDIGQSELISGFRYLPRQDGYSGEENGNLGDFKVYLSLDNITYTEAYSGTFDAFSQLQSTAIFASGINARYFKLVNEMEWIGVAEIEILTGTTPAVTPIMPQNARISVDRLIYEQGDNILASFEGSIDAGYWIGICKEDSTQYQGNSIGVWLYANSGTKIAGSDIEENGTISFDGSIYGEVLVPGEYKMYLMAQDWHTQVAEAHFVIVEKGGDTTPPTKPDEPAGITYNRTAESIGYAAGIVTITPPENRNGLRGFDLFWADDSGPLIEYTHIAYIEYSGGESVDYEIPAGVAIPFAAKQIIAFSRSWGDLRSDNFAAVDISAGDIAAESELLYSFQVLSDTHITTNSTHIHNIHLDEALKDILVTDPNTTAIFTVGDNTDHGFNDEWILFKAIFDSNIKDLNIPVFETMGNHDLGIDLTFDEAVDQFKDFTGKSGIYYKTVLNGNTFIILGSQSPDSANGYADIKADQLDWLDNSLAEASAAGGPTFVFLHQPLIDTVSGSLTQIDPEIQVWNGIVQDAELRAILDKYKNATLFTGHTHWQFDSMQPALISNGTTANYLNSASIGYLWSDENIEVEGSQGYYVEVYTDYVLVRGRDFENKKWVSNAQFILNIQSADPTPENNTKSNMLPIILAVTGVLALAVIIILVLMKKRKQTITS